LVALAQPAFAEEPAPAPAPTEAAAGEPAATVAEAPAGDPSAATPTAAGGTTVTDTAAPVEAPASRFPRSVIARPLTLPKGLAMIGADATANNDFSAMYGAPIFGYGITDDFEVQVPYTFATREFEAKGTIGLDVGYKLLRGALDGKFEMIARARAGYDALGEAATPLLLGVHAQYNFTPTIALISGYAGTQQLKISVAGVDADGDPSTMGEVSPIDIGLPIAVGYQPTEELYLQLDTKLATVNISDSANAFIFADATPVLLTAVYNVIPALDVQAAIGTDLTNSPGDALSFLVGARYYAGQL
jgi:hypothetical protein